MNECVAMIGMVVGGKEVLGKKAVAMSLRAPQIKDGHC
jgi:hypothetical protein